MSTVYIWNDTKYEAFSINSMKCLHCRRVLHKTLLPAHSFYHKKLNSSKNNFSNENLCKRDLKLVKFFEWLEKLKRNNDQILLKVIIDELFKRSKLFSYQLTNFNNIIENDYDNLAIKEMTKNLNLCKESFSTSSNSRMSNHLKLFLKVKQKFSVLSSIYLRSLHVTYLKYNRRWKININKY